MVKLIVFDIDGTLTDGKITYDSSGVEVKSFNVKDGLAIAQAGRFGVEVCFLTGRKSKMVTRRAKDLKVAHVYQGVSKKLNKLKTLCEELGIELDEVGYVGDDLNDLLVMQNVGFSACPKDAVHEVKAASNYISEFNGGNGVARDILEKILKVDGHWDEVVKNYTHTGQ